MSAPEVNRRAEKAGQHLRHLRLQVLIQAGPVAAIWSPRGTSPLLDPGGWLGDCEGGQTPGGAPSGLPLGDSMCARGRLLWCRAGRGAGHAGGGSSGAPNLGPSEDGDLWRRPGQKAEGMVPSCPTRLPSQPRPSCCYFRGPQGCPAGSCTSQTSQGPDPHAVRRALPPPGAPEARSRVLPSPTTCVPSS